MYIYIAQTRGFLNLATDQRQIAEEIIKSFAVSVLYHCGTLLRDSGSCPLGGIQIHTLVIKIKMFTNIF